MYIIILLYYDKFEHLQNNISSQLYQLNIYYILQRCLFITRLS